MNIPEAEIERPENKTFGDYSTNAALKLAKKEGENPLVRAAVMVDKIKSDRHWREIFEKIEIAGAGFINFYLSKEFLKEQVSEILKEGKDFGQLDMGQAKKISIDFVSANPTGPVHIGNARGGPLGDVLGNVLVAAGFKVSREYYLNDVGHQVEILGHSIIGDEQAQYRGQYIDELRKKIKGGDPKKVGEQGVKIILEETVKPAMTKLGINFDNWISEKELQQNGQVDKVLNFLKEKDYIYEKDGAWWFKASAWGDEKNRVVIKSTGEKTYFGSDIASHKYRLEQGADKLIDIWGADHHGDVKRMTGALAALGYENRLEIILTQFVRVIKDGQEMKMSKRAGTYVSIDDLIDEAGKDATRFFFLVRSPDTHMDFDLDLARQQSEKNPVYYVQYAYARISSILRKSDPNIRIHPNDPNILKLLKESAEMDLIKQLIRLPEIVEDTARDYQVQRLPQYALDLVRAFHKFYENCRVIDEGNEKLTEARLGLVEAARIVLKNTLDLMGVSAPEKM